MKALLCETVTADAMAGLIDRRNRVDGADMVELRLDGVADADAAAALDGRRLPAIVTCRLAGEGGRYRGPERARLALLAAAAAAGAEYVDLELRADGSALPAGARVVRSFHDMTAMPRDLEEIVGAMRESRPAVVKIAVAATRLADCVALRDATSDLPSERVVIAMGPAGVITRVCPWLFGSRWMYAGAAAPGQLPARVLRDDYRFGETSAATRVFGVVGDWERASALAPAHNVEFRRRGMDAVSVPLAAAGAGDLECATRAFALAGVIDAADLTPQTDVAARAARDVDRWMTT